MSGKTVSGGPLKVFTYLTAEKAAEYRAIMRVFTEAKARFALHLRPQEIVAVLAKGGPEATIDLASVEISLSQLCDWGNIEAHADTADVATVEEFYRPRFLYQLTKEGEAVERAIAEYEKSIQQPGELQAAALSDIRELLKELEHLADSPEPDEAKVHRTLASLRSRFDELTSKAQTFIASLQRRIDLQGKEVHVFVAYKKTLIEYLERFIGELVIAAADIAETLRSIDRIGVRRLIEMAARRDLVDSLAPTNEDREAALDLWLARWAGLKSWFIRQGENLSQAEVLRSRARSAIPALLSAVAAIHDRRITRSDRVTDLRTLACWFAEADSDHDAHRLWRAAFALTPARHLRIDDETLDERDAQPVSAQTSWLDAPPLRISPRLRKTGRHARGVPKCVIDRSEEKASLAEAAEAEDEQIAAAQRRLATARRMRLSEVGELDLAEFNLFLEILGEALAAKVHATDVAEVTSSDGALRITLEPTGDFVTAVIFTNAGRFSGQDQFIEITRTYDDISEAGEKPFSEVAATSP